MKKKISRAGFLMLLIMSISLCACSRTAGLETANNNVSNPQQSASNDNDEEPVLTEIPDSDLTLDEYEQGKELEYSLEEAEQQGLQPDGSYRYELEDGTVIYTEHDIRDYIVSEEYYIKENGVLIPKTGYDLDVGKMINDTIGSYIVNDRDGFTSFSFSDGGIIFSNPDSENERIMHAFDIEIITSIGDMTSTIRMFDCSKPTDHWLVGPNYLSIGLDGLNGIHPDLAPLVLFGLEQMANEPRSDVFSDLSFGENITHSSRRPYGH